MSRQGKDPEIDTYEPSASYDLEAVPVEEIHKRPRWASVCRAIGWVTFMEIVRDKVLYNLLLFAILLFGMAFIASRLSFLRPDRVILDFGLFAISISSSLIATMIGAGMIGREIERRTIYVALSRPISRLEFVVGKFLGLALVLFVNWLLISAVFTVIVVAVSESFAVVSETYVMALVLLYFQSLVLASLAMMFSSFSTTSLSFIITTGIYLVGTNISQIRLLAAKSKSPAAIFVLNSLATVLPNFEAFNLGLKVTYDLKVPWTVGLVSVVYALVMAAFGLSLAAHLIQGKET